MLKALVCVADLNMELTPPPPSRARNYQAYFTPSEVAYLSEKQRGKLSESQDEKARLQACGFIEAVAAQIGL